MEQTDHAKSSEDHGVVSAANGVTGAVAAIVADEMLEGTALAGPAAGIAAAVVGGAVVYALDHTNIEQTIGDLFQPAPMTNCLPTADPIQQIIQTVVPPVYGPDMDFAVTPLTNAPGVSLTDIHSGLSPDPSMVSLPIDTVAAANSVLADMSRYSGTIVDPAEGLDVTAADSIPTTFSTDSLGGTFV